MRAQFILTTQNLDTEATNITDKLSSSRETQENLKEFCITMNITTYHHHSIFISNPHKDKILPITRQQSTFTFTTHTKRSRLCFVRAAEESGNQSKPEKRSFLSFEEAGLVEISGLGAHEKFLCRLTISSLNLLRVISEQEGCSMEELNAGKICDWFLKDKLKREHNIDSAVLQWEDPDFPF